LTGYHTKASSPSRIAPTTPSAVEAAPRPGQGRHRPARERRWRPATGSPATAARRGGDRQNGHSHRAFSAAWMPILSATGSM
jgi:hypothetical protein